MNWGLNELPAIYIYIFDLMIILIKEEEGRREESETFLLLYFLMVIVKASSLKGVQCHTTSVSYWFPPRCKFKCNSNSDSDSDANPNANANEIRVVPTVVQLSDRPSGLGRPVWIFSRWKGISFSYAPHTDVC